MTERHAYITRGISRETFEQVAVRATSQDSDLNYYLHDHRYDPFGDVRCNDRCTLIRSGVVFGNVQDVTLSADANGERPL